MLFSGLGKKLKWLLVIVAIIVIVILVLKFTRAKAAIVDFIHREDGLAKAVDSLSGKSDKAIALVPKEVDFSERLAPVRPKKRKPKVKVEAENPVVINDQPVEEVENFEVSEEEVPTIGRGTLPRRKNCKTSTYKREEACRKIFEDYFDDYFPTCRPKFLANPKTGYPLELDGYNAAKNLAFEHQGAQHVQYPNYFHKTREDFDKQVERDEFKRRRLAELGIDLIEIGHDVPFNQLESYIHAALKKLGK